MALVFLAVLLALIGFGWLGMLRHRPGARC
jgi:hypothetical protein